MEGIEDYITCIPVPYARITRIRFKGSSHTSGNSQALQPPPGISNNILFHSILSKNSLACIDIAIDKGK